MKKLFSTLLLGMSLAMGAANAQVYLRIGPPPPPRREMVPPRPGPRYVWVPGYYRAEGNRYVWRSGSWVLPPGVSIAGSLATGATHPAATTGSKDTGAKTATGCTVRAGALLLLPGRASRDDEMVATFDRYILESGTLENARHAAVRLERLVTAEETRGTTQKV